MGDFFLHKIFCFNWENSFRMVEQNQITFHITHQNWIVLDKNFGFSDFFFVKIISESFDWIVRKTLSAIPLLLSKAKNVNFFKYFLFIIKFILFKLNRIISEIDIYVVLQKVSKLLEILIYTLGPRKFSLCRSILFWPLLFPLVSCGQNSIAF